MRITDFEFGSIRVDGERYARDIVVDGGRVSKRKKKRSKELRDEYGHTPLSARENIPWDCERLVVGTGAYGSLPVMDEVREEAERRGVELVVLPTADAVKVLGGKGRKRTNAVLHITC